ncbi:hypothetical protein CROQUDRAFT_649727 [Cronartium quercuum f. sp. fusiforme G11]|uniref:Peroxin-5 n=1 Tax=Cronartium quercuum f. sp. fusiforme G11 TaxID=708437 RepID=A0A9P6NXR2_9BASI|nr:hypothetical protein CROQUDRAFT_649727 [Cronartium quercuum f. sp. fusiforme G11]
MSSIPTLLQSGSTSLNCGHENPISTLSKHIQQDRSVLSHFPSTSALKQQSKSHLKPSPIQQEQATFFSPQPFDLTSIRYQLPSAAPDWSKAFLESVKQAPDPSLQSHLEPWRNQFLSRSNTTNATTTTTTTTVTPLVAHNRPTFNHQPLIRTGVPFHSSSSNQLVHHQIIQDQVIRENELDWESAFLQLDQSILETPNSIQSSVETIDHSESPDALALTAGSLLANIDLRHRAEIELIGKDNDLADNKITREKFESSQFMELMRKLRDGEIKVEGDKMVEQIGQIEKGKGKEKEDDDVIQTNPLNFPKSESGLNSIHQINQLNQKEITEMKREFDKGLDEMKEIMEADDKVREIRKTFNKFQGDGGLIESEEERMEIAKILQGLTSESHGIDNSLEEILEAASRVDDPHESHWVKTRVPGASERWSELIQEEEEEEEFDIEGMYGRPLTISEIQATQRMRQLAQPSIQQREWEALQNAWDKAFDNYNFTESNPYVSRHHSHHLKILSLTESVLMQEANVRENPESGQAWLELGVRQQLNEQEELAIVALNKALELEPELSEARLALAISYTNENRRLEAYKEMALWVESQVKSVKKYSQAWEIEAKPRMEGSIEDIHNSLTSALMRLARLGGRNENFASVDVDVQVALGVLFNTSEEYEKACDCFGVALAVRPEDPVIANRLGATLANLGKAETAIEFYYRALSYLPTYVRARYNLSIALINLGHYKDSAQHLLNALEIQEADSMELSSKNNQSSGVTSKVLWDTLEINCSFMQRANLMESCRKRDLDQFREQLMGTS